MLNYALLTIGIIFIIGGTLSLIKDYKAVNEQSLKDYEEENKENKDRLIIKKVDDKLGYLEECLELIDLKVDKLKVKEENDKESIKKIEHEKTKHTSKKEDIISLYKEGYSPADIAKKLDKGIGEVQLICNLKKR